MWAKVFCCLGLVICAAYGIGTVDAAQFKLTLPLGLQEQAANIPEDNPITPEKVALGKMFFWDKRWSRNGTVACVTCHEPTHGWADPRQYSLRYDGNATPRHSPTLINRLFSDDQQWTGARTSLEDQALKASDQAPELLVKNLGAIPEYQERFRKVFGTDLNPDGVAKAIAAYERMILSGNSAYDRFQAGDKKALSVAAQRGLALFNGKARCQQCHGGFNFSDEGYHNIGVGMEKENTDWGRFTVTKKDPDKGKFKTPTLRDVATRPPYMHDGSQKTLEAVVEFYNKGGIKTAFLSEAIQPLSLSAAEQADLVEFLKSLTGQVAADIASPPRLP